MILALGNGCREEKMIEACDFINSIAEDTEITLNLDDGYQIAEISDGLTFIRPPVMQSNK
ncbi:hypothetical protein [Metabacillus halosaccharovorans]|uniref:Uncharacterized protein n=1 Tax=Metabacillus halosaccharovorans TaxID=930124 RepID=A0ABT3DD05_9BACI|nr:hypothetical protein [Metabacillus halosaccharovorans]MCV9884947.1 hypothetical protein [Metabacillus halosaccharovorans]